MSAVFTNQELKITFTCKDAVTEAVIDLTGETVKVLVRAPDGTETAEAAVIEDAPNGICSYTFPIDTLDEEGDWSAKPYLDDSQVPGTMFRFQVSGRWKR